MQSSPPPTAFLCAHSGNSTLVGHDVWSAADDNLIRYGTVGDLGGKEQISQSSAMLCLDAVFQSIQLCLIHMLDRLRECHFEWASGEDDNVYLYHWKRLLEARQIVDLHPYLIMFQSCLSRTCLPNELSKEFRDGMLLALDRFRLEEDVSSRQKEVNIVGKRRDFLNRSRNASNDGRPPPPLPEKSTGSGRNAAVSAVKHCSCKKSVAPPSDSSMSVESLLTGGEEEDVVSAGSAAIRLLAFFRSTAAVKHTAVPTTKSASIEQRHHRDGSSSFSSKTAVASQATSSVQESQQQQRVTVNATARKALGLIFAIAPPRGN